MRVLSLYLLSREVAQFNTILCKAIRETFVELLKRPQYVSQEFHTNCEHKEKVGVGFHEQRPSLDPLFGFAVLVYRFTKRPGTIQSGLVAGSVCRS